jgi:hypothetical protein
LVLSGSPIVQISGTNAADFSITQPSTSSVSPNSSENFSIVFNPEETAENLKKNGGFIPGRRPGKNTSEYFDYVFGAMNHSTMNGWFPPSVGDSCRMCSFTAQCPAFGSKDFPLQIQGKRKGDELDD